MSRSPRPDAASVSSRKRSVLHAMRVLVGLCAAFLASTATAHPHVFIDYGVALLLGGDRIDGVRVTWTFDDLFSGFVLQEFDRDRNGTLSAAEIRQIEEKHLAEFRRARFFTAVSVNGQEVTPGAARDFTATAVKGIVSTSSRCPSARRSGRRPRSRS